MACCVLVPLGSRSLGVVGGSLDGWTRGDRPRRVLLVCPPYQHTRVAPLSTVLLSTYLRQQKQECRDAHVYFDLARALGVERYLAVAANLGSTTGELLFAEGLHGRLSSEARLRLDDHFGDAGRRSELREVVAEACRRHVVATRPDVVGFTTSLNQLLAALWLGRIIKQGFPEVLLVLGGASCTDPMGRQILAAYPHVDLVVSGPGELPLLGLARGDHPPAPFVENEARVDLDSLPTPDFAAVLDQAGEFADDPRMMLTFESSRGCWWGQKHHCRFCGLNGKQMRFSEKSSDRVLREVRALWDAHQRPLLATDTILSRTHLAHVLPRLGEFAERPRLFYEVKANLSQAEVVTLAQANAMALQPGIESLSTRLLQLLEKGTTAIQNLGLLKWCREQGISLAWNQLCGIPGEQVADYDAQIDLMEHIPHLNPPDGPNRVRIDRYSPYFERHREFGWTRIEPLEQYGWFHPQLEGDELASISFRFSGVGAVSPEAYLDRFSRAVAEWRRRHDRGDGLFLDPEAGLLRNTDGKGFRFHQHPTLDAILEHTHDIVPVARVIEAVGCPPAVITGLVRQGILYVEGNRVLNLAVRTRPPRAVSGR